MKNYPAFQYNLVPLPLWLWKRLKELLKVASNQDLSGFLLFFLCKTFMKLTVRQVRARYSKHSLLWSPLKFKNLTKDLTGIVSKTAARKLLWIWAKDTLTTELLVRSIFTNPLHFNNHKLLSGSHTCLHSYTTVSFDTALHNKVVLTWGWQFKH